MTLNDFTIELIITDEIWEAFQKFEKECNQPSYLDLDNDGLLKGVLLRKFLKNNIEKFIEEEFKKMVEIEHKDYEILMIEFHSNIKGMIKLHKERGALISGNA